MPSESLVIDTPGGPVRFQVEVAADAGARAKGLMHRRRLAAHAGMLFDFKTPVMTAFWMKDTLLPLDMIFVRADGVISTVATNAVPGSLAEIASVEPIRAVLEINGGLTARFGIGPGEHVHSSRLSTPAKR